MININGSIDTSYRYKMQPLSIKYGGAGNGLYTTINNMDDISLSLNTPPDIIYKFISYTLGSAFNEKKKSYTGHHQVNILQQIVYQYIDTFVICPSCNIPELTYNLNKISAKKSILFSKCSACGTTNEPKSKNKIHDKCIDTIIKYLNKEEWGNYKGNMVNQDQEDLDI